MFAYCQGNPINFQDSEGTKMIPADPLRGGPAGPSSASGLSPDYSPGPSGSLGRKIVNYVANDDEQVVINAKHFAMYKGVPVVKLPIGTDAFSFGIIFLGTNVGNRPDYIETVQHEYGHAIHYRITNPISYTTKVFLPSVIGYHCYDIPYSEYYSYVYEYTADVLGGVSRAGYPYSKTTQAWWPVYFIYSLI